MPDHTGFKRKNVSKVRSKKVANRGVRRMSRHKRKGK